jgi:hypothetical protein
VQESRKEVAVLFQNDSHLIELHTQVAKPGNTPNAKTIFRGEKRTRGSLHLLNMMAMSAAHLLSR